MRALSRMAFQWITCLQGWGQKSRYFRQSRERLLMLSSKVVCIPLRYRVGTNCLHEAHYCLFFWIKSPKMALWLRKWRELWSAPWKKAMTSASWNKYLSVQWETSPMVHMKNNEEVPKLSTHSTSKLKPDSNTDLNCKLQATCNAKLESKIWMTSTHRGH